MAVVAEDIKNAAKLLGTDLVIAYGLSHIHQYVADDGYRLMGPTGSGKSNVRNTLYFDFRILTLFKDHRHPYRSTWQAFRLSIGVVHD